MDIYKDYIINQNGNMNEFSLYAEDGIYIFEKALSEGNLIYFSKYYEIMNCVQRTVPLEVLSVLNFNEDCFGFKPEIIADKRVVITDEQKKLVYYIACEVYKNTARSTTSQR